MANKEILLQTTSTWNKKEFKELQLKKPEVTVLNINIGIGEKLSVHKHDLINIAYVKKGTLTVTTDNNRQVIVHEGECLSELIGEYHYGKNDGDEPVELVVFYIGEKGTPLSVDK